MEQLTKAIVEPLKGQTLEVCDLESGNKVTDLTIDDVVSGKGDSDEFESFSVEVSGLEYDHCPDNTYLCKHSAFGEVPLFITAYAEGKYQIIVSTKK